MSSPFSRSLRAIESERLRGWAPGWSRDDPPRRGPAWFLLSRIPLYETSALARIEATAATHPVDARMPGRVVRVNLAVGTAVRARRTSSSSSRPTPNVWRSSRREPASPRSIQRLPPFAGRLPPRNGASRTSTGEPRGHATNSARLSAKREAPSALARGRCAPPRAVARGRHHLRDRRARRAPKPSGGGPPPKPPPPRWPASRQDQKTRESDRLRADPAAAGHAVAARGRWPTSVAAVKRFEYEVERRVLRAPTDGRIAEAADLRIGAVVQEVTASRPSCRTDRCASWRSSRLPPRSDGCGPDSPRGSAPWLSVGGVRQPSARVTVWPTSPRRSRARRTRVDRLPAALPISHALAGQRRDRSRARASRMARVQMLGGADPIGRGLAGLDRSA